MQLFDEYDTEAAVTDRHDWHKMGCTPEVYCSLALAGEAGELANKVKKVHRDHGGIWTPELRRDAMLELGDVLWYASRLAFYLGYSMVQVAIENIKKLRDRQARGTLAGSGDHR